MGEMRIGLFDPGMTAYHRVGLAGLYMACESLEKAGSWTGPGGWKLEPKAIVLDLSDDPAAFFERLFTLSFGIDSIGRIEFPHLKASTMGDVERFHFSDAIGSTFLQHGQTRKMDKAESTLAVAVEDRQIIRRFKKVQGYSHQKLHGDLVDRKGRLASEVDVAGWLFPGAAVRHVVFSGDTKFSAPVPSILLFAFCPMGSLYYRLKKITTEGKLDARMRYAIVLPDVVDLADYSRRYRALLNTSVISELHAASMGDAGFLALVGLQMHTTASRQGVVGCQVVTMGSLPWDKKQKNRSCLISLKDVPGSVLQGVSLLQRTYPAKIILNEKKGEWNWWVAVSAVRGLFANNLALGQPWYQDFQKLMASKTVAQKARYGFQGLDGKGGFEEMIEHATFIEPVHKLFIQAMHEAIRRRYGALAARSAEKGERIPFDREFERMRTGLARAKNQQTLRAEIADLFSRSGTNSVLQAGWHDLLPLLEGRDWQMVRDLALIALASYGGKEAVVTEVGEEIEE